MTEPYELILCVGGNCATSSEGEACWKHLQQRVKELKISNLNIKRSECLGICSLGPTIVIFPEGTWYNFGRPDVIDRILTEHIMNGNPVEDFAFAIRENY